MEQTIFYQLSLVMVIAAGVSLVMRALRQPLVIGYILTGFAVGPSLLHVIHSHEAFESFSQIGIALLLFLIGLGLNAGVIANTGKPVFLTFLAVIIGIGSVSMGASHILGLTQQEGLIMAIALLFSSTIIVVKSLSDKREQNRLYGQIAIGILLAEDIAATLALLFVSTTGGGDSAANHIWQLIGKGALLAGLLYTVGKYLMPHLARLFATSQELLYVFALAWAFGIASLFHTAGFSLEVGALFAGVTLAHLTYAQEIATRLKPLRDFFIVLFFIQLGQELGLGNLGQAIGPALVFSTLIVLGKPLLIMTSLGALGYTKQTSFKAAVHLSQISEFSIVLVVLAQSTGVVRDDLIAITTLTALLTIAASAYLMKYDDPLFRLLQQPLSVFERTETKREVKSLASYPLILFGYRDGGYGFVQTFRQMKKRYIVIDYDPEVIEALERQHIHHLYGDATDLELLKEVEIHRSELIVSTLSNAHTNAILAKHISQVNDQAIFICHAETLEEAVELYEAGASYVLLPSHIGNEHINQFLQKNGNNQRAFAKYRAKHLQSLMTPQRQRN